MGTKVNLLRENFMKKIGRPTDALKCISFKLRIDVETNEMLEECSRHKKISKAEIIRLAIKEMYLNIEKEPQK